MRQRLAVAFNRAVDDAFVMLRQLERLPIGSPQHRTQEAELARHGINRNTFGQFVITGDNFGIHISVPLRHISGQQVPGLYWPPDWLSHPPGQMNLVYRPVESAGRRAAPPSTDGAHPVAH